jgi:hypothetical protein
MASNYPPPLPVNRGPDFQLAGWQFFALDRPIDESPDRGGDAKLRSPTGEFIGLVWDATGRSKFSFDFTPNFGPMLYVEVPRPVTSYAELRTLFEALIPSIEAAYRAHVNDAI